MRFQADHSIRTHFRGVDDARGQVEPVACVQFVPLAEFDQLKRDRAAHDVDDLVIRMRVRRVNIVRAIRPGVKVQAFAGEEIAQGGFGGRGGFCPRGDAKLHRRML